MRVSYRFFGGAVGVAMVATAVYGAVGHTSSGARSAAHHAGGRPVAPVRSHVKHVVVVDLDNTHLSDMEQMPAVRKFLGKGTLFSNDHTGLIAYTHPDYVTEATGLYPSRSGIVSQFQGGVRSPV